MPSRCLLSSTITGCLCALFGFAAGLQLAGLAQTDPATNAAPGANFEEHRSLPEPDRGPGAPDVEAIGDRLARRLSSELVSTLRSEIARALEGEERVPNAESDCGPMGTVADAPEDAWEQEQAFEDGSRILEEAVGERSWSPQHAEELGELLPNMSLDQRAALFASLAEAANRGDLELGDDPLAY